MEVVIVKKSNFTWVQFSCLIIFPILSLFSGIGTSNIIQFSKVDASFSVLFAYFIGLLILLLFLYIFNYKKELNITEKIIYLFGKYFGVFLNVLINILIFMIGIVLIYNISNFAISQFLSETPLVVFMALFGILLVYNVSLGIENIARVSIIFFGIICFLTLISTFGILPDFDFSNLKPFLENGIQKPLEGGIILMLTNIVPIFTLLMVEKDRIKDEKKVNKNLFYFYSFAFFLAFLACLLTIGSLGIYLCQIYQYPEYTVLKKISLFDFIDRIENFIYIKWILSSFICLSLILYYISQSIRKESGRIIPVIVMALIITASLYLFKNNTIFYKFGASIFPYLNLLLLVIFTIIGINIFIRNRLKN